MEEGQLYIYSVSLPPSISLGYDTYSAFVVVAESEEEARMTHPGSGKAIGYEKYSSWVKLSQIGELTVKRVGVADLKYKKRTVLCSSFHAG